MVLLAEEAVEDVDTFLLLLDDDAAGTTMLPPVSLGDLLFFVVLNENKVMATLLFLFVVVLRLAILKDSSGSFLFVQFIPHTQKAGLLPVVRLEYVGGTSV